VKKKIPLRSQLILSRAGILERSNATFAKRRFIRTPVMKDFVPAAEKVAACSSLASGFLSTAYNFKKCPHPTAGAVAI
jgi:hypothetical protein